MKVRLTQLDGKLPNLALMQLAHYHRSRGDEVTFTRSVERDDDEPEYDRVYGSAIFAFSQVRLMRFQLNFPSAIVGGTGTPSVQTVEELIGEYPHYDYTDYPDIDYSIGFTQRGCRLKCKFCVVPAKEGKNRSVSPIEQIWRGDPWPKKLHLLDNDFFGQPDWALRVREIVDGGFRICLSQGINVRLINEEAAAALATMQYRNDDFNRRRLYTAWDNLHDERVFFRGVDILERAGIPSKHLMAYMLIGYDKTETWSRIWRRFNRMVERGIMPYPMVYDRSRKDLCAFQRWVNTGLYRYCRWMDYDDKRSWFVPDADHAALFEGGA
jgi:hypothetical protein